MPIITSIAIYHVTMPLIEPWRTAYGQDDVIGSILVKMDAGGFVGWGETTPLTNPTYSPEYAAGVFAVIKNILAPQIIGKNIETSKDLYREYDWVAGNFFAKAGLDAAWWDLYARIKNQPLWKLIGGVNPTIDVGADFGIQNHIDILLANISDALNKGFKRIKLKYAPGWGLEVIKVVRKTFPNSVFHIDCNAGYTLNDLPMFKNLDKYNLAMIEQPLMRDDLNDHATLQRAIETPICLDESITSPDKVRKAIEIGAARWINIKPGRVGGFTNAIEINRICEERGIPCWTGGMLESALGTSFCRALATLRNMQYPSDVFPSSRFYKQDLSPPPIELSGPSQMILPDTPGVGAEPIPDLVEQHTINQAVIEK